MIYTLKLLIFNGEIIVIIFLFVDLGSVENFYKKCIKMQAESVQRIRKVGKKQGTAAILSVNKFLIHY